MKESYDCVIVGGGGAGAVLAAFLAHSSIKTLVVERRQPEHLTKQMIALSYASVLSLSTLLKDLAPHGLIQEVHVSCQGVLGAHRIQAKELYLPCLGWVLPMATLEAACKSIAEQAPNITWQQPAECHGYHLLKNHWGLVAGDRQIETKLLVAADGAHSSVAKALGLIYSEYLYDHPVWVAQAEWSKPHQGIAYERFFKNGTLAVLPLETHRSVCVWSGPSELLADDLSSSLGHRLGRVEKLGATISFPMTKRVAQSAIAARSVLLGNAAHTLHPIAAQGFNLTLRDAECLAELLMAEKSAERDLGDPAVLNRYQKMRKDDQSKIDRVTHGLAAGVNEKNWSGFSKMLGLNLSRLPLVRSAIIHTGLGGGDAI